MPIRFVVVLESMKLNAVIKSTCAHVSTLSAQLSDVFLRFGEKYK